jgi:HNH endonuclease
MRQHRRICGLKEEKMAVPTIFFNVSWMNEYRGISDLDSPLDGGSWSEKHEVCNFLPVDGRCYGFVQPPNGESINIDRIGATEGVDHIDGVTVVWSARARSGKTVVVGIYRNARLHRNRQTLPQSALHQQKGFKLEDYFAECSVEDAILISPKRRDHFIPRGSNAMGQSLVWYGDTEKGALEAAKVENLLEQVAAAKLQIDLESAIVEAGNATAGSCDEGQRELEEDVRSVLASELPTEDKFNLVRARVGQGKFRQDVMQRWRNACAVTGCQVTAMLRASHIKPWRDCVNAKEQLSADNGLMLTANLDALFDRGLISFNKAGEMLVSRDLSKTDSDKLGLTNARLLIRPDEWQDRYLAHHRETFGFETSSR